MADVFHNTNILAYLRLLRNPSIKIGNKAPNIYFEELKEQCNGGNLKYGGINDFHALKENLKMNCVPESIFSMDIDDYEEFLKQRRMLIAKKIRDYYFSL